MHYFATTAFGWGAGKTLDEAIDKARKSSRISKSKTAPLIGICAVPLPMDAEYEIRNYLPQVDGLVVLHDDIFEQAEA